MTGFLSVNKKKFLLFCFFSQGKKGKSAKNAQANQPLDRKEDLYLKAPHSFVFHRGHVGKTVKELVLDVRKLMEPYTASSLKVITCSTLSATVDFIFESI